MKRNIDFQKLSREELINELQTSHGAYEEINTKLEAVLLQTKEEKSIIEVLINASKEFIGYQVQAPDYDKITTDLLRISSARIGVLNLFDHNNHDYTAVALAGDRDTIQNGINLLGFNIKGKRWNQDMLRAERTKNKTITCFENLHDLAGDNLSKQNVLLIEESLMLGKTYLIKVLKEDRVLGDFTLIFDKNQSINNARLCELYAHQVGIFIDRYQISVNLAASEARMLAITDSAQDAIMMMDHEGTISYWNPSAQRIFGYTKSEAIGHNLHNLIMPDQFKQRQKEAFKKFQNTGKGENIGKTLELVAHCKDGSEISIQLSLSAIKLNDKWHSVGIIRDITSRIQAERDLLSSKKRFKTIFSEAPLGMALIDPETGHLLEFNRMFIKVTQRNESELLNINWMELTHPDDKSVEFDSLNKQNTGKINGFHMEKRFQQPDGTYVWINQTVAPFITDEQATPTILIMIEDINSRKLTEQEIIRKNQELFQVNLEKDKFFSIIAHDLKSPFNSIVSYCQLLDLQVKEKDYHEIENYTDIILRSSNNALDLLMNLMEWAQSQTGRMKFNPEHFNMNILLEEILPLFIEPARLKSISIVKEFPLNINVFADKAMISTIWRNMLSNAIKFTNPRGVVTISGSTGQNEYTCTVSDTGVGIDADRQNKLFKIDENHSTLGTQDEKGTGLGLILCHEFIEKHKGRIWVDSEPGKGSCFYFSIPYK
ncbi:MAG: PAS domain S-box protein [Bacteroidales bacterium]|nr:PAS domain S-box protein [Bacteroidales bacterium]